MKKLGKKASRAPGRLAAPRRWPKSYVVVADAGVARILRATRSSDAVSARAAGRIVLADVAQFENPAAHVPARELVTDRTGRVYESGGRGGRGPLTRTRHGAQSDYDPHAVVLERFAGQLARRLDEDCRRGRYEQLVVIAGPKFLGVLRPHLSAAVRKLVTREVRRDLVKAGEAQIRRAAFGASPTRR